METYRIKFTDASKGHFVLGSKGVEQLIYLKWSAERIRETFKNLTPLAKQKLSDHSITNDGSKFNGEIANLLP